MKNPTKKTWDCWGARILHQTRIGQYSSQLVSSALEVQTVIRWRGNATVVNMALSQLFCYPSENNLVFSLKSTFSHFKQFVFYVHKIWDYEIGKSLHFVCIYILDSTPTFWGFGVIYKVYSKRFVPLFNTKFAKCVNSLLFDCVAFVDLLACVLLVETSNSWIRTCVQAFVRWW